MVIPISNQGKRTLTQDLKNIRCPREGCEGDLHFMPTSGNVCGGYIGNAKAIYRCDYCMLRFEITNPRSFGEPCEEYKQSWEQKRNVSKSSTR